MDSSELRTALAELHPASYGWAVACCGNRDQAEEVLQTVYLRLLEGRGAEFQGRSTFRTWLFRVIRNAARDQQRRRWFDRVVNLEFLARSAQATAEPEVDQEAATAIRAAVNRLSPRQRQVAHLVFYENMTIDEAAKVMEVALGTARRHYDRAKQALRQTLTPLQDKNNEPLFI